MQELEGLAKRHMLEYFRVKKISKQAKNTNEDGACGAAQDGDCGTVQDGDCGTVQDGDCGTVHNGNCAVVNGDRFSGNCMNNSCMNSQSKDLQLRNVLQGQEDIIEQELEELRVTETYKMLIFPENTLRDYLRSLDSNSVSNSDSLRKEFRQLAILIHPDKNQHPQAKVAFQKLYSAFMDVLQQNN